MKKNRGGNDYCASTTLFMNDVSVIHTLYVSILVKVFMDYRCLYFLVFNTVY